MLFVTIQPEMLTALGNVQGIASRVSAANAATHKPR